MEFVRHFDEPGVERNPAKYPMEYITGMWSVRGEDSRSIITVLQEGDAGVTHIVFSSFDEGERYLHVNQEGISAGGYTPILEDGIFKGKTSMDNTTIDMGVFEQFRGSSGLPSYVQPSFDRALSFKPE